MVGNCLLGQKVIIQMIRIGIKHDAKAYADAQEDYVFRKLAGDPIIEHFEAFARQYRK